MPSKYVIHTVGPVYSRCGDNCNSLLASSYAKSLELAHDLGCKDIAFPAISTGIYGFPKERAAKIAFKEAEKFLSIHPNFKIVFVFHNDRDKEVFKSSTNEV